MAADFRLVIQTNIQNDNTNEIHHQIHYDTANLQHFMSDTTNINNFNNVDNKLLLFTTKIMTQIK